MKVFAMFVSILALSRGMPSALAPMNLALSRGMPSVLAPMNLASLNVTNKVDCSSIGPSLLTFAYAPDPASANALRKRGEIFALNSNLISSTHDSRAYSTTSESSSLTASSKYIAGSFKIGGSFMAFSGSASLKFHSQSKSQHQSLRRDEKLQAFQCELRAGGDFHTRPEKYLSKSFKWAIENRDVATLAKTFGAFYAKGIQLGGQYAKTYIMEKTSKDTSNSFSMEIKASFGIKKFVSVDSALTMDTKNRKNTKNGKIERKITWLGGDTSVLLGTPVENTGQLNAKWAATFNNDNLYPFSFELAPIWDLVKSVNQEKGLALEKAFASTWAAEFNELNRQINSLPPLPFDPIITDHAQRNNAKEKAYQRKVRCVREADSAQSWIDTWWAHVDITRNRNWRTAARNCQKEMDDIRKFLDDSKKSVAQFKSWLRDLSVARKSAGSKYWGIGGRDSVESNRVNLDSHRKIEELRRLF